MRKRLALSASLSAAETGPCCPCFREVVDKFDRRRARGENEGATRHPPPARGRRVSGTGNDRRTGTGIHAGSEPVSKATPHPEAPFAVHKRPRRMLQEAPNSAP